MFRKLSLILVLCPFSIAAHADDWNKATLFAVAQPFVVPGAQMVAAQTSFPAGTYVIKLNRLGDATNIVQIFNCTQQELFATILGIPAYREQVTGKPVFIFGMDSSGLPALTEFFYPGDNYGQEFPENSDAVDQTHDSIAPALAKSEFTSEVASLCSGH